MGGKLPGWDGVGWGVGVTLNDREGRPGGPQLAGSQADSPRAREGIGHPSFIHTSRCWAMATPGAVPGARTKEAGAKLRLGIGMCPCGKRDRQSPVSPPAWPGIR